MYNGKTILAVIPARGGSKGVKRKNIRPLAGKPLIAWTIDAAKKSAFVDRVILSSEDAEIMTVAKDHGCEVPFTRPSNLSADDTPGVAPLLHAIEQVERHDYVVLLQPTSPLREACDIDDAIRMCIDGAAPSTVSVTVSDKHPAWMYELDDLKLRPIMGQASTATRRQDLPPVYTLNGAVYVVETNCLLATSSLLQEGSTAYIMPKCRSLDIDTEHDLRVAEFDIASRNPSAS